MHNIIDLFDIEKKDIISITGSGGKTSLMFELSDNLKKNGSVLITTSTKIAVPTKGFDKIYLNFDKFIPPKSNEVVVIGEKLENIDKLSSIGEDNLSKIKDYFDYVLIEADGCRNLPIKFWKEYEPLIYDMSNKSIGVFSIKVYGKKPHPDFVYNYDEFIEKIGDNNIDYMTFNKLIDYKKGLFKDFVGTKYVFFNQVEDEIDFFNMDKIEDNYKSDYNLRYGSIKKGEYYEN